MLNILSTLLGLITCKSKDNDEDIGQLKLDLRMIKENHLYHIEKDIAEMKTDIKIILSKL